MAHSWAHPTCTGKQLVREAASCISSTKEISMWRTQHSAQSTNRRRSTNLLLPSVPWLATILLTAASGQSAKLPRFQDHSVSSVYRGEVRPPDFGNPDQYDGTDLRDRKSTRLNSSHR